MTQQKFTASFKHAINGIRFTIKSQRNMKIHLLAGTLSVALGIYLGLTNIEWAVLTLCISIVLTCETINTAIEENVNLVTSEYNEHAKHAKDAAAGATLIASGMAIIIGSLLFLPKILSIIKGLT